MSDILSLKSSLSEAGQRHYVEQETIRSTHPLLDGNEGNHPPYDAALILVSERHAKGDLSELVGHLLARLAKAEPDAARYRFLRDGEYWQQSDRYWEALSAGGDDLDRVIDGGLASQAESEGEDDDEPA